MVDHIGWRMTLHTHMDSGELREQQQGFQIKPDKSIEHYTQAAWQNVEARNLKKQKSHCHSLGPQTADSQR